VSAQEAAWAHAYNFTRKATCRKVQHSVAQLAQLWFAGRGGGGRKTRRKLVIRPAPTCLCQAMSIRHHLTRIEHARRSRLEPLADARARARSGPQRHLQQERTQRRACSLLHRTVSTLTVCACLMTDEVLNRILAAASRPATSTYIKKRGAHNSHSARCVSHCLAVEPQC
jgi:hypothetical protein